MSLENPLHILYNTEGLELAVSESQVLTGSGVQPGILLAGSSSSGVVHFMRVSDTGAMFITGTVAATATMSPNTPVSQGLPGGISDAWNIKITDGTQVIGTGSSAPIWISGTVTVPNTITIQDGGNTITVDGTVNVGNFPTVQSVDDNGGSLTVDDGGGSLTIDGTVSVDNFPVTQSVKIDQSITLPVSVSNFPAIQTVTGTVTAQINQVVSVSNGGPIGSVSDPVYVSGSFAVNFDPSTSATVTSVSSSATAVTLQAANGSRRALTIYNLSTKNLFVKLGTAATTTVFSAKLSSNGYYEVPGNYTGIVTGIWDSANGAALVTEILD
jgi:hypothetical protein